MASMQPLPAPSEGPLRPKGVLLVFSGGYAVGYTAALGVTGGAVDLTETLVAAGVQGVIAAVCWVFWQNR
ncbi:hypothetical protein [Streptomyces longisporoflavus]|uniref:Integral membrane protein n=1 Tax=Streptomyces longisporoflavus TaxID=28044 RepID=A0ABW7QFC2_9ACTN